MQKIWRLDDVKLLSTIRESVKNISLVDSLFLICYFKGWFLRC